MFGPRFGTIFASRWRALWFAGSMLLLAYCSVPSPEDTAAQRAEAAKAEAARAKAANPWKLDTRG